MMRDEMICEVTVESGFFGERDINQSLQQHPQAC